MGEKALKMITMKLYAILITMIFNTHVYSQVKDSIIYILPDRVETKLYEMIQEQNYTKNRKFEFHLTTLNKDTFSITCAKYDEQPFHQGANSTNRFILVNNNKYPATFDYDYIFGTPTPSEIGEFRHREGYIRRNFLLSEGYSIIFDKTGNYLHEDYGNAIKKGNDSDMLNEEK